MSISPLPEVSYRDFFKKNCAFSYEITGRTYGSIPWIRPNIRSGFADTVSCLDLPVTERPGLMNALAACVTSGGPLILLGKSPLGSDADFAAVAQYASQHGIALLPLQGVRCFGAVGGGGFDVVADQEARVRSLYMEVEVLTHPAMTVAEEFQLLAQSHRVHGQPPGPMAARLLHELAAAALSGRRLPLPNVPDPHAPWAQLKQELRELCRWVGGEGHWVQRDLAVLLNELGFRFRGTRQFRQPEVSHLWTGRA